MTHSIELDTATDPIVAPSIQNYASVVLGTHEDGTPVVEFSLGRQAGASRVSQVHYLADADFVEGLAQALMAAADHLHEARHG